MHREALEGRLEAGALHVWVLSYGITHHAMHLALHKGDFPRHIELICLGVTYFAGEMQGGAQSLRLVDGENGQLELRGERFLLRFERFEFGTGRT